MAKVRQLVVVLGDQLDRRSTALEGIEAGRDVIWMAEVAEESTHVWTHKQRIAVFLAAMRHFAADMRARGLRVDYRKLDETGNRGTLAGELREALARHQPEKVVMAEAGEWRVAIAISEVCAASGVPLEVREDRHFLCTVEEFRKHAAGRKQLRMEFFYREMRKRYGILMEGDEPAGGAWNYDAENREAFGKSGPEAVAPMRFVPTELTREVLALVEKKFARHPGQLEAFGWPVTPEQARQALADFVGHRLAHFGRYQDAMWQGQPFLNHSLLSVALNLKLLDPREILAAAENAWKDGYVDLASAEGFIRQILGWREYVRGLYWLYMPDYVNLNALGAQERLPEFYWSGETGMACLRDAIGQTLEYGYAHHIQRLMVTGLYALLLGVDPQQVHEWYLAVYVDAVEWVELPNTLGMSQYADGGLMASKPYVATGKYIQRMSNYCAGCPYEPTKATGERACPFTTLYWDFLMRHEALLGKNQRMALQVKNLKRLGESEKEAIRARAEQIRKTPAMVMNA